MTVSTKSNSPDHLPLLKPVLAGEFRAVARLITMIENESPESLPYIRELFRHTGGCYTVGVTGAPGSGKSTLVDRLASAYRALDQKVGIIAVDPTSPFSGGAILGDRIRMQSRSLDSGTFIRSMATRGHLGGLTEATFDTLMVLDVAGFDVVIVETVGVGQDEVEIVSTADTTLVVLVPGMGDDIQAMKAGIMEIADVFVVNKADHPGVERIDTVLHGLLSMYNRADGWVPQVVKTIATEDTGTQDCMTSLNAHREHTVNSEFTQDRLYRIQRERLLSIFQTKSVHHILDNPRLSERLDTLAEGVTNRELDPYSAASELLREAGLTL